MYSRFFLEEEQHPDPGHGNYQYVILTAHGDEIARSVLVNHPDSTVKRRLVMLVEAANCYYEQESLPAEALPTACLICGASEHLQTDGRGHTVCTGCSTRAGESRPGALHEDAGSAFPRHRYTRLLASCRRFERLGEAGTAGDLAQTYRRAGGFSAGAAPQR